MQLGLTTEKREKRGGEKVKGAGTESKESEKKEEKGKVENEGGEVGKEEKGMEDQ